MTVLDPANATGSEEPKVETQGTSETPEVNELDMLKSRAKLMGIPFSPNVKDPQVLKDKIAAKLAGDEEEIQKGPVSPELTSEITVSDKPKTIDEIRKEMLAENMKLLRVRITNMDPKKRNLPGEILSVGNDVMGVVRKFIPYGEVTDGGYHIPYILYKALIKRKFLDIKVSKNSKGQEQVTQRWVKEFAIDILPPLTTGEMAKLAAAQAAMGGVGD
ncbi:hypothetical protein PP749_gp079 [Rhizobium phage RHEph22]|uniref:Uncharacterized protein n=1 Tax=Rhizobium phage RHEph22 TaxID=2836135 RepID=A0AAE8AX54_9CAUD|nr:hypothetical protein PP749_gp079 [Rhizobium phage RHEph22]QXV74752.1 hypothetical protein [Rhizobium phage RHEph22]QXV74846.1 hypothetical protein [Rhizobium phage RHEph24]